MSALENLAKQADYLDSTLVTREDGRLESMYTDTSQIIRDRMHNAVLHAYELLQEIREGKVNA